MAKSNFILNAVQFPQSPSLLECSENQLDTPKVAYYGEWNEFSEIIQPLKFAYKSHLTFSADVNGRIIYTIIIFEKPPGTELKIVLCKFKLI